MMSDRIVTAAGSSEEEAVDRAIRPKKLADYVGQEQVKAQLEIFVKAAVKRGEALDHALIFGPPGLGKTTLANILASELGVLDFEPEDIALRRRLGPGQLMLVDTKTGTIEHDDAIKARVVARKPYADWVDAGHITLGSLPQTASAPAPLSSLERTRRARAFGITREDLRVIVEPMARNGEEPVGSIL